MESEYVFKDKKYKTREMTMADRETLYGRLKSLEFTPAFQMGIIELCVIEPKLTLQEIRAMSTAEADGLVLHILQTGVPTDSFLSLLKNTPSQEQPQPTTNLT